MTPLLDLGDHAGFIWAAYGVSLFVLAGLIGWIRLDARNQSRLLAGLEAQGVQRRSKKTARKK